MPQSDQKCKKKIYAQPATAVEWLTDCLSEVKQMEVLIDSCCK